MFDAGRLASLPAELLQRALAQRQSCSCCGGGEGDGDAAVAADSAAAADAVGDGDGSGSGLGERTGAGAGIGAGEETGGGIGEGSGGELLACAVRTSPADGLGTAEAIAAGLPPAMAVAGPVCIKTGICYTLSTACRRGPATLVLIRTLAIAMLHPAPATLP